MTFHEEADRDAAFARVPGGARAARGRRASSAASCSSTTRASSSRAEALAELALRTRPARAARAARSSSATARGWSEDERADTLAFLERHGLAYVSVDAPRTRATNVVPPIAAATHPRRVRPLPRPQRADVEHPRRKTSAERFDWMYSPEELAEWVEPLRRLAAEADEVYALFNNNR